MHKLSAKSMVRIHIAVPGICIQGKDEKVLRSAQKGIYSGIRVRLPNMEIRTIFGHFPTEPLKCLSGKGSKKRPNTIPVFGPGKWLLGESRALKVGINAG